MKKRIMITILDSINQTTMPYNEFILYRNKHYKEEQQVLILTGNEIVIPESQIPDDLIIYKCGKNPFVIRTALKEIKKKAKQDKQEIVIHLHSIRGAFSTFLAMIGLELRKCTIYSIHSTFPGFRLHNKLFCLMNVLLANNVTCVSNTSYSRFPSLVKRLKGKKMIALQNGVNEERIDHVVVNYKRLENDFLRFVYVARLIPLKNHSFLVDVLADLPRDLKVKFVFIGLEDSENRIRKYAVEKSVIDRIEFTGLVPREQVYNHLFQSDVYISSSTLEGLPISVLEGMYCGLPAILSDIPQHREVGENCDAVSILPFIIKEWAKKIIELYDMKKDERRMLGIRGRKYVVNHFSLKRMHENYDIIYSDIRISNVK